MTVCNHAFVIGELGLILKGPNKNLREFLKKTAGKGVNSKHRYQALISRILNVTLKESLQIYKWFRTGARPERAKAKVLPPTEYQSKLASFMKLRGEGKTGLRGPDPKDPNLTNSTQTIWRSKARSIESHQSAGNPSEKDEASQEENSMRGEKED